MNRKLEYYISESDSNQQIGLFLKKMQYSHPVIVALKKTQNGILLNNEWARTSDTLRTGDHLVLSIVEQDSNDGLVPTCMPLDIIFEDQDIIVLNKKADTPIHPSLNNYENTLANGLAYYYRNSDGPFIMRCLNRLDRDTTGLTVVAKNMLSAAILSRDMKARKIKRTYYAVLTGTPDKLMDTINAPIARSNNSLIAREVNFETGQEAITHYHIIVSNDQYSLAKINLETGRTHQIRVHMKYIGHPLPGDYIYNPVFEQISRQALHAGELEFIHPITGELLIFSAPLPDDMMNLIKK